jgi:hypothetical protein
MSDLTIPQVQAAVEKVLHANSIAFTVKAPGALFLTHKGSGVKMTVHLGAHEVSLSTSLSAYRLVLSLGRGARERANCDERG